MTTVRDIINQPFLSKCFHFDASKLNLDSGANTKAKLILTCKRCKEEHEYSVRSMSEKSLLKCSCKRLYKSMIKNAENTTSSASKEPKQEQTGIDLSKLICSKFYLKDGLLRFQCCENGLYSPSIVHKLSQMTCQFCTTMPEQKVRYVFPSRKQVNFFRNMSEEIKRLQEQVNDHREYLMAVQTQFAADFHQELGQDDQIIDASQCLESLKDEYDDSIADNLERIYQSFKSIPEQDLKDFVQVHENSDLSVLYDIYINELEQMKQKQQRLDKLQACKYLRIQENTDIGNLIEAIKRHGQDFDYDAYCCESLESYLRYRKKNRDIVIEKKVDKDTYKCKCNQCQHEFFATESAVKLLVKNIHSCPSCYSITRVEPVCYDNDLPWYTYTYIHKGKYAAGELE